MGNKAAVFCIVCMVGGTARISSNWVERRTGDAERAADSEDLIHDPFARKPCCMSRSLGSGHGMHVGSANSNMEVRSFCGVETLHVLSRLGDLQLRAPIASRTRFLLPTNSIHLLSHFSTFEAGKMATDTSVNPPQTFEQFSKLPNELKCQIWSSLVQRRRILQVHYNADTLSWRICKDSLRPDPVSQVNQQARQIYTIFLDVAILPHRDIILIGDPKFSLRPIQKAFLNENDVRNLQHISFTADVW